MGFAWFGPRFNDDGEPLEETSISRAGGGNFKDLVNYQDEYQPGALRYDVGERANFVLMPMAIAALEQILAWTPEGIQDLLPRRSPATWSSASDGSASRWKGPRRARGAHLLGLRPPAGVDPHALTAQRLSGAQGPCVGAR